MRHAPAVTCLDIIGLNGFRPLGNAQEEIYWGRPWNTARGVSLFFAGAESTQLLRAEANNCQQQPPTTNPIRNQNLLDTQNQERDPLA